MSIVRPKINKIFSGLGNTESITISLCMKKTQKSDVMTFKARDHFRAHLKSKADEKGLNVGTYIKAILKKHTGYKEPELV